MPHPAEFKERGGCEHWTFRWDWTDGTNITLTNLTSGAIEYFGVVRETSAVHDALQGSRARACWRAPLRLARTDLARNKSSWSTCARHF